MADIAEFNGEEKFYWLDGDKSTEVFILCKTTDGKEFTRLDDSKQVFTATKAQFDKRSNIMDIKSLTEANYPDLVLCGDLTDASIIYTLERRLKNKELYTFVGDIVIAMNPFCRLPVYTNELIHFYNGSSARFNDQGEDKPEPHLFYTSDNALYNLWTTGQAQSIIISGESGAGKTETAKQVLHFIGDTCAAAKVNGLSFEDLILQSSPVLEALGNARTKRNDNSSRFGKYCTVYLSSDKRICGCNNIPYLLEKSRVTFQDMGERNFHVFYQLLKGKGPIIDEIRTNALLRNDANTAYCEEFNFLNKSGCIDLPTKNDVADYKETEDALRDLKLPASDIWTMVAVILFLGNAKFFKANGEESSAPDDIVSIKTALCDDSRKAAQLLGLDEKKLNTGFCCKVFQKQPLPLKRAAAENNKLTFCKFMYDRLFIWIVDAVNESMMTQVNGRQTQDFIGILDIFGFEKFLRNSLEQLCINFTNERLQYQFNSHVFAQEKKIYAAEDLDTSLMENAFVIINKLVDHNKGACTTIGGAPHEAKLDKNCILLLLNEVSKIASDDAPKQTKQFIESVFKTHTNNKPPFTGTHVNGDRKDAMSFVVDHYAGPIVYYTPGFVEKDRDTLVPDLMNMILACENPFVRRVFQKDLDELEADAKKGGAAPPKKGIALKFNEALRQLMKDLDATGSHYIRCIKSNDDKAPLKVFWPEVLRQLMYAGVQQVITIRKHGYLYKTPFEKFVNRYHACLALINLKKPLVFNSLKEESLALLAHMQFDLKKGEVLPGKTRLFYRIEQHRQAEKYLKVAEGIGKGIFLQFYKLAKWKKFYIMFTAVSKSVFNNLQGIDYECCNTAKLQGFIAKIEDAIALAGKLPKNATFPFAGKKRAIIDMFIYMQKAKIQQLIETTPPMLEKLRECLRLQSSIDEALRNPDPEAVFETVKELVKASKAMGFDEKKNPALVQMKTKIEPVIKKNKMVKDMELALSQGDEKTIKEALASSGNLGLVLKPEVVAKMKAAEEALVKIEKEKKLIAKFEPLVQTGGWMQDGQVPVFAELEKVLAEMKAWPGGISGRGTKQQMFLAEMLIGIRKTLAHALPHTLESEWEPVGKYFDTMDSSIRSKKREIEGLMAEAEAEAEKQKAAGPQEDVYEIKGGKSVADFLQEDIKFVESISGMAEFKRAQKKYEDMSVKSKIRKALLDAADSFDLALIEEKIAWARSQNMHENSESSLAEALRVLAQLKVVCEKCQAAIEVNRRAFTDGAGIADVHIAEITKVIALVDSKYPNLVTCADYKACQAELKKIGEESRHAAELRSKLENGSWASRGAVLGNFDTYPEYPMAAINSLIAGAQAARDLPLRTVKGKLITDFASKLAEVRTILSEFIRDVKQNPTRSFIEEWENVGSKMDWLQKEFKVNSSEIGGEKVAAELEEYNRQLVFQRSVIRITKALLSAEENRVEAELESQLAAASNLAMLPKFNPVLAKAQNMLRRLKEMNGLLVDALERVNLRGLEDVLAIAKDLRFEGEKVIQCARFRDILLNLAEAEKDYDEKGMAAQLEMGKKAGMNQEAAPIVKAISVLQRVIKCREIATSAVEATQVSIEGSGATESQLALLSQALEIAAGIGGQRHVVAVNKAANILEILRSEDQIIAALEDACYKGAWVNAGVRQGDFDHYQSASSINVTALNNALESARAHNLKTFRGRSSAQYAELLVQIRTALCSIFAIPIAQRGLDLWSPVAKAMESPVILALEFRTVVPELSNIRRELLFNGTCARIFADLAQSLGSVLKIRTALAEAHIVGMSSTSFPLLAVFKNILAALERLEETISGQQEDLLFNALSEVKAFEQVPAHATLVQRGNALLAELINCREGILRALSIIKAAETDQGVVPQQTLLLDRALQKASRLGGQTHLPCVLEARKLQDEIQDESVLVGDLVLAFSKGAFTNAGISPGDWGRYQSPDSIQTERIRSLLSVQVEALHTAEARRCVRFGQALLSFRSHVIAALKAKCNDLDRWSAAFSMLSQSEFADFEYSSIRPVKELEAVRHQAQHASLLRLGILELENAIADVDVSSLVAGLNHSERLGLDEKNFSIVNTSRIVLSVALKLTEAVTMSEEKLLLTCLRECKEHNLNPQSKLLVRAQALLQKLEAMSEIETRLSMGIQQSDEKALKAELLKFADLGLPENPRTIEARRVQAAIADVQRGASDILASMTDSVKFGGISIVEFTRLKDLVAQVDNHLAGLPGVEVIGRLRAQLAAIVAEQKTVAALKVALSRGGWTNSNAKQGDLSTYQSAASVDAQALESVLSQQGEFVTEAGRWLARWSRVVIRLRQAVVTALQQSTTDNWRAVEAVVLSCLPQVGANAGLDNPAFVCDHVFSISFTEFVAARAEYSYQFGMGERKKAALAALQTTVDTLSSHSSIVKRCELLRASVESCITLELRETKEVQESYSLLTLVQGASLAMRSALSSLDFMALSSVLTYTEIPCQELSQCLKYQTALSSLENMLKCKDFSGVRNALNVARECGIPHAPLCLSAEIFIGNLQQQMSSIDILLQGVNAAKQERGIVPAQYEQMSNLLTSCSGFAGVPGFDVLKSTVQQIENEQKVLVTLKELMTLGGFLLDRGVACGDYKNYPRLSRITWGAAESTLEPALKAGLITVEGRWMKYYCSKIIGLRKLMLTALTTETKTSSTLNSVLIYLMAPSAEEIARDPSSVYLFPQLVVTSEWQAAVREINYQKIVVSIVEDIQRVVTNMQDLTESGLSLSNLLQRSDEFNMGQVEQVVEAKKLLEKMQLSRKLIKQAMDNHELLPAALLKATDFGFKDLKEVVFAKKVYEINLALLVGMTKYDGKSLKEELKKFSALGLPENSLTSEARRILAAVLDVEETGSEILNGLIVAQQGEGISLLDSRRIREFLEYVDSRFNGLRANEVVTRARLQMQAITAEQFAVDSLKDALCKGGWTNSKARLGDFSSYQPWSSVDLQAIPIVLTNQGEFVTEAGRWLAHWACAVVELRKAVVAALQQGSLERWRVVEAIVQKYVPQVNHSIGIEHSSFPADHVFYISFPEFVAARTEYTYQFSSLENKRKALSKFQNSVVDLARQSSIVIRCERLNAAVETAVSDGLREEKDVFEARVLLENMERAKTSLLGAARSLVVSDLQAACDSASDILCAELTQCSKLNSSLASLAYYLDHKDYLGVMQALNLAREQGAAHAPLAIRAQEFLDATHHLALSIEVLVSGLKAAKLDRGVEPFHYKQMLQLAQACSTLTGVPGIDVIKAETQLYDSEMKRISQLKETMSLSGGFVLSNRVECGDYNNYPKISQITFSTAESELQAAVLAGFNTTEGRWMQYYCSKIIMLRSLVFSAFSEKTAASWDAVLGHLLAAESDLSQVHFYSRLACTPEWLSAAREARHQKNVFSILIQLQEVRANMSDLTNFSVRLSNVIRRADDANMAQLEPVVEAKALLGRITVAQGALRAASEHHNQCGAAIKKSIELGFGDMPEVKRCKSMDELFKGLQVNIAYSDEKALKDLLVQFSDSGNPENFLTIEARRVQGEIANVERLAHEILESVADGMSSQGVQISDCRRLKEFLAHVDHHLAGLRGVDLINKVRAAVINIEAEHKLLESLRIALGRGGWLNTNGVLGNPSTYQSASTVNVSSLESVLLQQQDFVTENGRWMSRWVRVVIRLRQAVYIALMKPTYENWRAVQTVVEENEPQMKISLDNVSFSGDYVFWQSFKEFSVARTEYTHRFTVEAKKKEVVAGLELTLSELPLHVSIVTRCEKLRAAIDTCANHLITDEKAIELIRFSRSALEGLEKVSLALKAALEVLDIAELANVTELCDSVGQECEERTRCLKLLDVLKSLSEATASENIHAIQIALSHAREVGAQHAPVAIKALEFFEGAQVLALSVETLLQSVQGAKRDEGVTVLQYEQLLQIAASSTRFSGMASLSAVKAEIQVLGAEFKLVAQLKQTLSSGGFVLEGGVQPGDYKRYPRVSRLEWEEADFQVKAGAKTGRVTAEGRWMQYYASKIIVLRKLLVTAFNDKTTSAWDAILTHLSPESDLSLVSYYSKLVLSPEYVAAVREAHHQKTVIAILNELQQIHKSGNDLTNYGSALSAILRRAEEANILQLDQIIAAKELLLKIKTTHESLLSASKQYSELNLALTMAIANGFEGMPEVQRCRALHEVVTGLQVGIATSDINSLNEILQKVSVLGMQENHLTVEARRFLEVLTTVEFDCKDVLASNVASSKADGITQVDIQRTADLLAKIDSRLGGCKDNRLVGQVRQHSLSITSEQKQIQALNEALSRGGWLNKNATVGIISTYQAASTIEVLHFESALSADFVTAMGRSLVRWVKVVVRLRLAVLSALQDSIFSQWQAVDAIIQESILVFSPSERAQFSGLAEFEAAKKEVEYNRRFRDAFVLLTDVLHGVIPAADRHVLLKQALAEADAIHMNTPEVAQARIIYQAINNTHSLITQALSTLHPQLLAAAVTEAVVAGIDTDEVKRCQSLRNTIVQLQDALDALSIDGLAQGLQKAATLGMAETSLTTKARATFEKLSAIKSQAESAIVVPPRGLSARHIEKLRWVIQQADTLQFKGLNAYPAVQTVRVELLRTDAELKLLNSLRTALDTHGWVSPGLGKNVEYLKTQSLRTDHIEGIIEELKTVDTKTEEGRWLFKWASIIVSIRTDLREVGKEPFASLAQWKAILDYISSNESRVSPEVMHFRHIVSEVTFFSSFPEFVAIRQEVAFQEDVQRCLKNMCKFFPGDDFAVPASFNLLKIERDLEEAVERFGLFNIDSACESKMMSVNLARDHLFHIRNCRRLFERGMLELDERTLREASTIASEMGLDACTEVGQARAALAVAQNLRTAIASLNVAKIQAELFEAERLGVSRTQPLLLDGLRVSTRIKSVLKDAKMALTADAEQSSEHLELWSGPKLNRLKKLLTVLNNVDVDLQPLLGCEELLAVKEEASKLQAEVDLLNKDGMAALQVLDVQLISDVITRAKATQMSSGSFCVEKELFSMIQLSQCNPTEFLRLQRRADKDTIVRALEAREKFVRMIEDFERDASDPKSHKGSSLRFLEHESFRRSHYPKLHQMQADLRVKLRKYEEVHQRRLMNNGEDASDVLEEDIAYRFGESTSMLGMRIPPPKTEEELAAKAARDRRASSSRRDSTSRAQLQQTIVESRPAEALSAKRFQELAERIPSSSSAEDAKQRNILFRTCDMNGIGRLTYAELERGVGSILNCSDVFKPRECIVRAANAAKKLGSSQTAPLSQSLSYREFKTALSYLRQYFEYWAIFFCVDVNHDSRVSLDEFKIALDGIQKWGVSVTDAKAVYDEIDTEGKGNIAFDDFAEWAILQNLHLAEDDVEPQVVSRDQKSGTSSGPGSPVAQKNKIIAKARSGSTKKPTQSVRAIVKTVGGARTKSQVGAKSPTAFVKRKSAVVASKEENVNLKEKEIVNNAVPSLSFETWQSFASKIPLDSTQAKKRISLFKSMDSGSGLARLPELVKTIELVLNSTDVFNIVSVVRRAFSAAKQLHKSRADVDGLNAAEFKTFLSYLRHYFEYWGMFSRIDINNDQRVNFQEFEEALQQIKKWGVTVLDSKAVFQEIDVEGLGSLYFDDFANWAILQSIPIEEADEASDLTTISIESSPQPSGQKGLAGSDNTLPKSGASRATSQRRKQTNAPLEPITQTSLPPVDFRDSLRGGAPRKTSGRKLPT